MTSGHTPDVGAELEINLEGQHEPIGGSGRLGWQEAGMEPVREIVQENPELAEAVKELMEGALARSTMNTYQGTVTRYQEFCESAGYDRSDIPEKSVLHYITYLGHQRAGLARALSN
jgi:hypothetical protein